MNPSSFPPALYSCHHCAGEHSFLPADLSWSGKISAWVCAECWYNDRDGEEGQSLEAAMRSPGLEQIAREEDPAFTAWTKTLPAEHWARYDLSAARLGWNAALQRVAPAPVETPCFHEWYQGQCIHCELLAKDFRKGLSTSLLEAQRQRDEALMQSAEEAAEAGIQFDKVAALTSELAKAREDVSSYQEEIRRWYDKLEASDADRDALLVRAEDAERRLAELQAQVEPLLSHVKAPDRMLSTPPTP